MTRLDQDRVTHVTRPRVPPYAHADSGNTGDASHASPFCVAAGQRPDDDLTTRDEHLAALVDLAQAGDTDAAIEAGEMWGLIEPVQTCDATVARNDPKESNA